ncbi:MAG: OmpA family protein [Proteobacteria bacterium]|nr:OmpA family protein [Pseudomonadota bacterium]
MLRKFLIASAAGLLLAACQQQPQMASPPPTQVKQLYVVYFNTGQADLLPEAQAKIAQAAATFKQGGVAVLVKGHADTVGDAGANLRLSLQRSAAVKAALMSDGVPESAIRSGGLGEENLPLPTADQTPERLNRSVHVTVSGRGVMSDKDYCAALARKWRSYSRTGASGPAPQAIAQCDAGNYDAGITTLETILTNDKIVLPSRYL